MKEEYNNGKKVVILRGFCKNVVRMDNKRRRTPFL